MFHFLDILQGLVHNAPKIFSHCHHVTFFNAIWFSFSCETDSFCCLGHLTLLPSSGEVCPTYSTGKTTIALCLRAFFCFSIFFSFLFNDACQLFYMMLSLFLQCRLAWKVMARAYQLMEFHFPLRPVKLTLVNLEQMVSTAFTNSFTRYQHILLSPKLIFQRVMRKSLNLRITDYLFCDKLNVCLMFCNLDLNFFR